MKKIIMAGLLLMLGVSTGYSQVIQALSLKNPSFEMRDEVKKKQPKKNNNRAVAPPTKTLQERYNELKLTPEDLKSNKYKVRCLCEHTYIKKGDELRIKYVFNPKGISGLSVVNAPSSNPTTTKEDIKKGEWIVVVKPEKTMTISVQVKREGMSSVLYNKNFILVLEPEEYEKVHAKRKEFEADGDEDGWFKYYWQLAGKAGVDYQESLLNLTIP